VVIVVVAAASLAIDARPGLAAFYRSRVRRPSILVVPRYVATSLVATIALGLGVLCALYETSVLIGPMRPGALAAGYGLGSCGSASAKASSLPGRASLAVCLPSPGRASPASWSSYS
jgi:hypothetical protein